MNCALGSEKNTIASLNSISGVTESHGTFGLYDLLTKIESDTEEGLQEIVTRKIRNLPGISSTMTLTRSECEDLFKPSEKLVAALLGKNPARAYVVIHTDKGEEYSVLKSLSNIPEIKEADVVFGFYDVLCKIESSDQLSLENVITKAIRKLPHVKTSMTLNVISEQD